jgi:phosphoribosylaminoimidazolecarboxamide formyltransferase/IMP cyclohydrolase
MITDKIEPGQILFLGHSPTNNQLALDKLKGLGQLGWNFISAGNGGEVLNAIGVQYNKIESFDMDGGCVANSRILAGILADRESLEDMERISDLGIRTVDIVLINIQKTSVHAYDKNNVGVNNINAHFFAYLIAGIQNLKYVNVIVDPTDCGLVVREISTFGCTSLLTREMLAKKALDTLSANLKFVADTARYKSRVGMPILSNLKKDELALV